MTAQRIYPTNAPRGGSATLTGAGSINDIFTFSSAVTFVLQNNTAATIYVTSGGDTQVAATQGNYAVAAGVTWISQDQDTWLAIYGAAATAVNGTTTGGIVLHGVL